MGGDKMLIEVKTYVVSSGSDLEETLREAIEIAKNNNCEVRFNFNGVEMKVRGSSNINKCINYFEQHINKKIRPKSFVYVVDKESNKIVDRGMYIGETDSVYLVKIVVTSALGIDRVANAFDKKRYELIREE
jgi:hypothetical protein